jgi:hypothetical protein
MAASKLMTLRQPVGGKREFGTASSTPTKQTFRSDIEGLRAVAVLAVVLFHAGVPGVGGGYVGVDVFFVISGFLITGLLWRELSAVGTVRLPSFYGARATAVPRNGMQRLLFEAIMLIEVHMTERVGMKNATAQTSE